MNAGLIVLLALLVTLLGGSLLVHAGLRANECDWGRRWCNCIDGWVRLFCRRYHRLQSESLQLPENGGAIVAANHVSGLDPLLLISASRRPLRFMIAVEEYQRFGLNWLFRAAGCIPVDRSGRPEQSFRAAVKALRSGEVVALFPHGKIHLDSDPVHPIKPGVLKLAELADVPIHPVRLTGIKGERKVIGAVFERSRARLSAYTPVQASAVRDPGLREALGNLLIGRKTSGED